MKISYNWLKQYINIDLDQRELAEILTNIGLEVEGVEEWVSLSGGLEGVVTGEVLECAPHPNADTLSITRVNIGASENLAIVCGAPNVAAGQKVAVATIGTKLYIKDQILEIKRSKIRGEVSEGMICAEDELGLGEDHMGIIVLPPETPVGIPAAEIFNIERDLVFEIGLTPNRIDSGSHFGVARDLAAYLNQEKEIAAIKPEIDSFKIDNNSLPIPVTIENENDCPRYCGITISNIKVEESPLWLINRLKAIGLAPINNIVDITNFVLHEIGQPLHAFDADKIEGKKILVKNLPEKTRFTTLDDQERELSGKDLMICDTKKGLCIGGIFGGKQSGITLTTHNIFLEAAYFNPVTIRKSARRHGLNTDASFRFERGADPNITLWALKRAAMLIREIAGGEISSEIVDNYPVIIPDHRVVVLYSNISRLIGKDLGSKRIKSILSSLEISILSEDNGVLELNVPAYRVDVTREADVIEEILRIYGYNNIDPGIHVNSTISYSQSPDREKVKNSIADMLSGAGYSEIMSNSLNPALWYEESSDFDKASIVKLSNPLSSDLNAMRQSLLFGGLSALARNINRQNSDLKFYEFGSCYFKKTTSEKINRVDNYSEKEHLGVFITGNKRIENWNHKEELSDFFYAKSIVEMVLSRLGLDSSRLKKEETTKDYLAEGLSYYDNQQRVVEFGKVSKKYLSLFDIKQEVYYCDFNWSTLLNLLKKEAHRFSELPRFPSVRRDLALLVDKGIRFSQIRDLAFKNEREILKDVGLFDVYESETLGSDKKSYAVSFILRDDRKTLTDKMIEKVINGFVRIFEKELDAKIR